MGISTSVNIFRSLETSTSMDVSLNNVYGFFGYMFRLQKGELQWVLLYLIFMKLLMSHVKPTPIFVA